MPTKSPSDSRRRGRRPAVPYQLKVSLIGIEPEIWRRIAAPSNIKLSRLHDTLQAAMGWKSRHLHRFKVGSTIYMRTDFEMDIEYEDEAQATLADIVPSPPGVLLYEYDLGDSWNHLVVVENYWMGDDREAALPLCVGGAGACPPEDVGGLPGYQDFLRVVLDSADEEHESMLAWAGGTFDPQEFDMGEANKRLERLRPRGRVKAPGR